MSEEQQAQNQEIPQEQESQVNSNGDYVHVDKVNEAMSARLNKQKSAYDEKLEQEREEKAELMRRLEKIEQNLGQPQGSNQQEDVNQTYNQAIDPNLIREEVTKAQQEQEQKKREEELKQTVQQEWQKASQEIDGFKENWQNNATLINKMDNHPAFAWYFQNNPKDVPKLVHNLTKNSPDEVMAILQEKDPNMAAVKVMEQAKKLKGRPEESEDDQTSYEPMGPVGKNTGSNANKAGADSGVAALRSALGRK